MFLGTGNDGKVMKVERDGRASVFYDSAEMEVHALAAAPNGGLYAGTSPDGRIYRIDAKGQATPFFDPDDKYIWALAVDAAGNVFAGTGDKGTVYKITPDGKGDRFFTSKSSHAVALTFDQKQQLLVATGTPGRVFRVDATGKAFLLLDTTYQEIHSIRVDPKGVIYAAAQSAPRVQGGADLTDTSVPPPVTPSIPNVSTEITSMSIVDVAAAQAGTSSSSPDRRSNPTGAVFRVQPDGLWDEMWAPREDAPYDIAIEPDGSLLVATGTRGKLFRLSGDPVNAVLVTRVPAQQATTLLRGADRTYIATSNPGLLMAISTARATRGIYESDVKDARLVSSWGVIAWRATAPAATRVEIYTRAGNTRTPDDAWSEWAGPYANAEGSPITSPKARYLQWRAVLTGTAAATPTLTSVSAAYLPRNIRPQVLSITVHPPGVVFQKPFSSGETEIAGLDDEAQDRRAAAANAPGGTGGSSLGRRIFQKGLQTFAWKAEDDNSDELSYDVFYRREGDTTWRVLKQDLRDTLLVWDTSSVPNGTYVLKVHASDRRSNPADTALAGELESNSFEIDNVAPTVQIGALGRDGARFVVPADIRDGDSAIARVEYSVDAQRWQTAFPRDGILDARQETFELRLEADTAGRTLVIRATDALGNVGTGQVQIR
jgi:sugar lactone lactonase YvrE